jgi:hypothetical protein
MHSDFSFSKACWRGRFSQKLSRFPTRNACADAENKWFDLTGRVVVLKVETDGDIDIALIDATGDKPRTVVVEIPAKPQSCKIRNMVFSWTRTRFPFHTSSAKKLNVTDPPIITVIGKAYFDVGHAPKDQSNWRKYLPGYAAWEIHPVMKIELSDLRARMKSRIPVSCGKLVDKSVVSAGGKMWYRARLDLEGCVAVPNLRQA